MTLGNGFIYDDIQQIFQNPLVHSLRNIGAAFGSRFWSFLGAEVGLNYYRPLATITYMLCWSVSGPLALDYHLVNIALNAANVGLVYWVTKELWDDAAIAMAASVIFALHPIHTEPVAWISGVADLELTFFYLLTFGLYLQARRPGARPWMRLATLLSFGMALLSKETAITLPVLVALYEHSYAPEAASGQEPVRDKIWRYAGLWVESGLYLAARAFLAGLPGSVVRHSMNLRETVLSGVASAGLYLGKLVWPASLHLVYPFRQSESATEVPVLAGLLGLSACVFLFAVLWRRARFVTLGLMWLGLTVAPVLNLRWMPRLFAERYLYLPSVGFCWLLACAAVWVWHSAVGNSRPARIVFGSVIGIILALCLVRIETRNPQWHDPLVFTLHEVAASPNDPGLHDNLGALYWQKGDPAAAEREWNIALGLDSEDGEAFAQLGQLRTQQKRYPEAITFLEKALRSRPAFLPARVGLGNAYAGAGRLQEAEAQYRAAVNLAPLNVPARNVLAQLLYDEGRWSEAESEFQASVAIQPTRQSCDRLGALASARGDTAEAIRAYTEATVIEPYDGTAHLSLGDLYSKSGQPAEAIREYERGLATNPKDVHALTALLKLQNSTR